MQGMLEEGIDQEMGACCGIMVSHVTARRCNEALAEYIGQSCSEGRQREAYAALAAALHV